MLDATIGPDDRDPFSIARPERSFVSVCDRAQAPGALHGLRIGWSVGMGHIPIDPEIATICQAAARRFEELGCTVEEADPEIPDPLALLDTMYTCAQVGAHGARPRHELGQMDPKLVATVEKGRAISAAELVRATVARQRTQAGFRKYFERYDLLLTPACAVPPFDLGIVGPTSVDGRSVPHLGWQLLFLFNYTGHPGSSAPCGRTTTDLPVGLQIVGPRFSEPRILACAKFVERVSPPGWAPHAA
jgi:aspartyl-tRNA(Asn)/glutamyl-tRNA(Gln) amidotransferase subunit A